MKKIAVIMPLNRVNYISSMLIDGLAQLRQERSLDFHVNAASLDIKDAEIKNSELERAEFVIFAKQCDLIFFINGKYGTNFELAEAIGCWQKTIFIDVSELGKNRRFDFETQYNVLNQKYDENGYIDKKGLSKSILYFRREKPYINNIIPFPFGIEQKYHKFYSYSIKKDIDFNCIFGQDEYPLMRRYAQKILVKFCENNNFSYQIKKTKSPDEFYKLLARTKIGISIGGGGFDTARFWEILGNNCLLLTEKIDIYQIGSKRLAYDRIWEFGNLYDFAYQLDLVGKYLRTGYSEQSLTEEYEKIIIEHSSKARVLELINSFEGL